MFELYSYLGMIGVIFGMFSFVSNSNHLLSMLLSLEYIGVSLFFILGLSMKFFVEEDYIMLYFLSILVCEGGLGLGIMVSMIRCWGSDYFSSYSLLQC